MQFAVVTLFPEWVEQLTSVGVLQKAAERELISVQGFNPRDHAVNTHRTVDDRPFGGGPGMLMQVSTTQAAIEQARQALPKAPVVYLSPQGRKLDQQLVCEFARMPQMILLAGRYEGVDERLVAEQVDFEVSLGDYVLSGGELGAMVVIDAVSRMIPGVLGDQASAEQDSFANHWLDCPHYTRPVEYHGKTVPEVLRSGHHGRIEEWRLRQSIERSWDRRPDLFERKTLSTTELSMVNEYISTLEKARTTRDGKDDEKPDY